MSKYVSVDREGTFAIEGDLRVMYATMMMTRLMITRQAPYNLLKALTIGIRYSVVRLQFKNNTG